LSVGGPIVKINYFTFFVWVADRNESVLNAPGSVTSNISKETVQLISDKLKSKYNYDPGISSGATIERNSFFLDYNYNIN
jgi:predicted peptidase